MLTNTPYILVKGAVFSPLLSPACLRVLVVTQRTKACRYQSPVATPLQYRRVLVGAGIVLLAQKSSSQWSAVLLGGR